jgi:hypothetical protein
MNDATAYEMSRLMSVFIDAHPHAKLVMVGLDTRWCVTGRNWQRLTGRAFPEWMYDANRWADYREMFNLHAVETAGRQFGIVTGLKPARYGRDGYTTFVPPDTEYDPARVAAHLAAVGPSPPEGDRSGPPDTWEFPALALLREAFAKTPDSTRKLLFYVPYHRNLLPPPGSGADIAWNECKRRIADLAHATKNTLAVDFMLASPITLDDNNYWDALHYRVAIADRVAQDLAAAAKGETSPDYRILAR